MPIVYGFSFILLPYFLKLGGFEALHKLLSIEVN